MPMTAAGAGRPASLRAGQAPLARALQPFPKGSPFHELHTRPPLFNIRFFKQTPSPDFGCRAQHFCHVSTDRAEILLRPPVSSGGSLPLGHVFLTVVCVPGNVKPICGVGPVLKAAVKSEVLGCDHTGPCLVASPFLFLFTVNLCFCHHSCQHVPEIKYHLFGLLTLQRNNYIV